MNSEKTLKVWAPFARNVEAATPGKDIPMAPATAAGWWETQETFPPGTRYGFRLDGSDPLPDPRSASQPDGIHGLSCIVDPDAYVWRDHGWTPPRWEDAVIYELHVGTFSEDGTFDSAIPRLDHLVELGVTHAELMPVVEFPGERNWGYDGVSIFAPHHAYGGPEALKRLVDACHSRGLGVILDVVYNHMGPDGNYLPRFGPYFTDKHMTPWGAGPNLDDQGSREVRRFFIDNALMWLRDYRFDGLRLDAIDKIHDDSPEHFLISLRKAVDLLSKETGRPYALIAESAANDPTYVRPLEDGGYGMDAQWNDDFHHALRTTFTGEKERYYVDYEGLPHLEKALKTGFVYDGQFSPYRGAPHGKPSDGLPATAFLAYTQTHDQAGNRPQGDRFHHDPGVGRIEHKIAAAITLLAPYVPMIFMGEEWASHQPFLFFTDHQDPRLGNAVTEGRRQEFGGDGWDETVPDPQALSTFLRSKLDWERLNEEEPADMLRWYRALLRLRKSDAGHRPDALGQLDAKRDPDGKWLDFRCGRLRVIACFSGAGVEIEGTFPSPENTCMSAGPVELRESGALVFTGSGVIILKEEP